MRIAVTGATGFLGTYTVRQLLQDGHHVVALGRNTRKGEYLSSEGANFKALPLSDLSGLKHIFSGAEAVVHCAGLSSLWGSRHDFFLHNVVGTQNVCDAALAAGVRRLVHISSPSIYITTEDREDIREDEILPTKFINHYAWSKAESEKKVDVAAHAGLEVITLRPQALVGKGDDAIFPRILKTAERGRLPVIANGQARMDFTCVENVVDAVVCALHAGSSALGHKYNISNDEPVRLYDLLRDLIRRAGLTVKERELSFGAAMRIATAMEYLYKTLPLRQEPPLTRYSVCLLGRSRTLNIAAARRDLGYTPRHPLHKGIESFLKDWQETKRGT